MGFDIKQHFRRGLPAPAVPFQGYPEYNFVGGHNDNDSIPVDELIAAATRSLEAEGRSLATYGLTSGLQGHRPLRDYIAKRLKDSAGLRDGAREVLVTSGSMQGLELVNALLLEPDDCVIVEEASYGGALARLKGAGVSCRAVRLDDDGIDTEQLARLLAEQKSAGQPAKYIYTIPTVQNPTGCVMTVERRRRLIELAEEFDCVIFEDDCYADLLWQGQRPPAIRALDTSSGGSSRVIYCGSFSKTIAPALRVGYVVADWPAIAQMLALKSDAGTGALEQLVLADYCPAHFDDHVEQLTQIMRRKCETMVSALEEHFGATAEFTAPKGGIFIWITLPEAVDAGVLALAAIQQGVAINPGADWTVDGQNNRHRMRLCFGHPSHEIIRDGVAILAQICHREFGVPQRGGNVARGDSR